MDQKTTSDNLIIAKRELAFQKDEKGKRAEELIIANKELAFQTEEKGKRAEELVIANKELAYQNKEKGKRASELVIANEELAYQTKEKGKRADELILANKELDYQNKEKGKRAYELISYKHFFYNSLDLACFVTPDGYFEEVNRSFIKTVGYTAKELTEKKLVDFLHPDDVLPTIKGLEYLASGVSSLNSINRYKTKHGGYRHIEWNSVYNHETKKIYATGRDITDKMTAIKELTYQNAEKENRAAELATVNKELAFQNEEKEKRTAELAIANKELAFQNEEKEKRAAELVIANKELAFQNKEKEKRAEELSIANSELKKAEAEIRKFNEELEQKVVDRTVQLEAVNKELESFSYSVSHDLRAPIRAINGYAKILEEDHAEKLDLDGLSAIYSIINNSKKMGLLIDDLLAFSKLGRKQVSVSDLNMGALVKSIKDELLIEDRENKTEFVLNELPPAKGDNALIKQVWINLISNAIKYSKYKFIAHIEIGAYEKDNMVVYYVKDNGAGFDMQYYDKLFGVFQRLHSQEEFEGTGIGLAIVQRIVQRHNGTVWAESKLNEETTFYFSLPNINS